MQQQVLQFGVLSETDIFTIVEAQPYDLYSYDYSPGSAFIGSRFFYSSGEEVDYDGVGRLTRAEFTAATGAPYSSYEYDYVGGAFAGSKFDLHERAERRELFIVRSRLQIRRTPLRAKSSF